MKKQNIFLIGPMGSGKSTIGKNLAQLMRLPFYDSDQVIESRTGVSVSWIFELEGEEGFRHRESFIISELTQLQGIVLATGGGVVVTPENLKNLSKRGIVIYLNVSIEIQLQRTRYGGRPLLNCADPKERLLDLNSKRDPLYRSIADLIYNTDDLIPLKLAQSIKDDVVDFKK